MIAGVVMGWKTLAWAGSFAPVLAGCVSTPHTTCPVINEVCLSHTQRGIERDLRKDARTAWKCVRSQYPRRAFTDEFHDGFLDGFVDYLDRGGDAQPPAVPPMKYVRNKKYFTPEGHCLVRDYYLGFKYGTDVALATGRRQFLTVPVLVPDGTIECPPVPLASDPVAPVVPYVSTNPLAQPPEAPGSLPLPTPRPLPANPSENKFGGPKPSEDPFANFDDPPLVPTAPIPKPELPLVKPFNPTLPDGSKFAPLPVPPEPDLLPIPDPPLPIPTLPVPPPTGSLELPIPPLPSVPPGSGQLPDSGVVPAGTRVKIPEPPDEVPAIPAHLPTPSILDDIPVIPFKHLSPPPLPVNPMLLPRK